MKRAVNPSISADSVGSEPTARRVTDQIDPYALIDRAERLLNTNPHDAVMFALRAQSGARARGAEALMARAHYVAGAALTQTGDWSGAIRQLSHAEHIYRAQNDIASQCQVIMQLAAACSELGEYPGLSTASRRPNGWHASIATTRPCDGRWCRLLASTPCSATSRRRASACARRSNCSREPPPTRAWSCSSSGWSMSTKA
jgi:hypothetical protein